LSTTAIAIIEVIIVVLGIVFAYIGRPKRYRVISERVANGVNVEKCSNCGTVLSQDVYIQSALGSSFSFASSGSRVKLNG
jgi:hypothetical protein